MINSNLVKPSSGVFGDIETYFFTNETNGEDSSIFTASYGYVEIYISKPFVKRC